MAIAEKEVLPSCPRCRAQLSVPVYCEACGHPVSLSEPASSFELLGLPRRFDLSETQIDQAYRNLTRKIHPDRFATRDEELRAAATVLSARLNEAYRQLIDPVSRASYLLELAGGPAASELRDVDPMLLGQVMMWREQLESELTEASLADLRNELLTRRQQSLARISEILAQIETATDSQRREARVLLNGMKYLDNLLSELDRRLESIAATSS